MLVGASQAGVPSGIANTPQRMGGKAEDVRIPGEGKNALDFFEVPGGAPGAFLVAPRRLCDLASWAYFRRVGGTLVTGAAPGAGQFRGWRLLRS